MSNYLDFVWNCKNVAKILGRLGHFKRLWKIGRKLKHWDCEKLRENSKKCLKIFEKKRKIVKKWDRFWYLSLGVVGEGVMSGLGLCIRLLLGLFLRFPHQMPNKVGNSEQS